MVNMKIDVMAMRHKILLFTLRVRGYIMYKLFFNRDITIIEK